MEDNRLIAEFMGAIFDDNGMTRICDKGGRVSDLNLQYHTSWDWLMPVVSKCFKTGDDTHQWDNIMDTLFTCDKNIVYAQVVEFIKEFN